MPLELEHVTCILCGTDNSTPLYKKDNLTYVRCRNCELVYVNPRLKGKSLQEVYEGSPVRAWWKNLLYSKRSVASFKNLDRRFQRAELLAYEILKYKDGGRILDIGCNRGFLLATAVSWGWEAYGIEIVPWFPTVVAKRFPMKIFAQPLREITPPFDDHFFDAVTMIDIIEHLADPLSDLREIHRIINPDGILLVNTLDLGSAYAQSIGESWGSVNPQEHFYLFDRQTLGKIADAAGFRIHAFQPSKGSIGEMEVHLRPKEFLA